MTREELQNDILLLCLAYYAWATAEIDEDASVAAARYVGLEAELLNKLEV